VDTLDTPTRTAVFATLTDELVTKNSGAPDSSAPHGPFPTVLVHMDDEARPLP
jgi:hypothetical protein